MGKYCFPNITAITGLNDTTLKNMTEEFYNKVYDKYNANKFTGYMKDIIYCWWVILVCAVIAIFLGFFYLFVIWMFAQILVWVIIVLLFFALWGLFFLLYFYANHYPDSENTHTYLKNTSYAVLALIAIYVVGVICCLKPIWLATAII